LTGAPLGFYKILKRLKNSLNPCSGDLALEGATAAGNANLPEKRSINISVKVIHLLFIDGTSSQELFA
jgi:hypothetical protein